MVVTMLYIINYEGTGLNMWQPLTLYLLSGKYLGGGSDDGMTSRRQEPQQMALRT